MHFSTNDRGPGHAVAQATPKALDVAWQRRSHDRLLYTHADATTTHKCVGLRLTGAATTSHVHTQTRTARRAEHNNNNVCFARDREINKRQRRRLPRAQRY